jgi:two-component system OmpR family response regulator
VTSGISVFSTANRADVAIYPHDVFALTDEGRQEIQSGSTRLPARALEVLVMLDGKSTVGDLEQRMSHMPAEKLRNLLRSLLDVKLIRSNSLAERGDLGVDFDAFFKATGPLEPSSPGTEKSAGNEAATGAPELQRKGYYVSIARKAVKTRTPAAGAKLQVVAVDDDPDLTALVQRLLEREGFAVAICATRNAIIARLRAAPPPDLVMLDVAMPDVNGFEVLQRMKTHAQLKAIPVVMLTADAKPESVMRGLALGADGYVSKPFDHATLVKGVKAVLGL